MIFFCLVNGVNGVNGDQRTVATSLYVWVAHLRITSLGVQVEASGAGVGLAVVAATLSPAKADTLHFMMIAEMESEDRAE